MILDVIGRDIREQPSYCMLFTDDIVLCSTRREHVQRKLDEWRRAMEERGLEISRKKTAYVGCNEHQDAEIDLQGDTVNILKTFTHMGSTLVEDGERDTEVTHRVHRGGRTGVLCDRKMNVKIKGTVTGRS